MLQFMQFRIRHLYIEVIRSDDESCWGVEGGWSNFSIYLGHISFWIYW